MNLTNCLLSTILFILVKQFYPDVVDTYLPIAIFGLILYGCYWLIAKFPSQRKKRKEERKQEEKDETEFWEYQHAHDAIRRKYDPANAWDEATSYPEEYLDEIRNLNLEHQLMLQRRNGWSVSDFA